MTTPPLSEPAGQDEPVAPDELVAFKALVKDSLPAVRSSAQAWRTGLTGLITLVTTGIVLTGRTATTDLGAGWKTLITAAIGAGLALAVTGLWHTLAAEAGTSTQSVDLSSILATYGGVEAYTVALAVRAGKRLHRARVTTTWALGLLVTGVVLTWWAPPGPARPPAFLDVTHVGGRTCGALQSADGGFLRLEVPGAHTPAVIALADIINLTLTTTCPTP